MEIFKLKLVKDNLDIVNATLLSIEEYEACKCKDVIKDVISTVNGCDLWLRSPGGHAYYAATVHDNGYVNKYGGLVSSRRSVRPALVFNPDSCDLSIGDKVKVKNVMFTVISKNMMLADECIGRHCFRKEETAPDANAYETSDVKKYVDKWFEGFHDLN